MPSTMGESSVWPDGLNPLPEGTKFIPRDELDTRPDAEIVGQITRHNPVVSNRNIWAFWKTGWSTMRPWCKRNVIGWIRRQGPSWQVRVLDMVPHSPNNVYEFLEEKHFPEAFNNDNMEGAYVGAHSADLVRLACLNRYGGVWMDVSIMLFRKLEDICWTTLTDTSTPFEIGGFVLPNAHKEHQIECGYMENWFIASPQPGNPFITRWHQVFLKYWENTVESRDAKRHPLFDHLDTEGFRQDMIDYLAQHLSFQRVRTLVDTENEWDGPAYYREKMFFLDARQEAYYLPDKTQWNGPKCFDILASTIRSSGHNQHTKASSCAVEPEEARRHCFHMAANCCLMKSVHGFKGNTQLSDIWNKPENETADIRPGSCAEYLSATSLYLEQTRSLRRLSVDETTSLQEKCLHAPLLQPCLESDREALMLPARQDLRD